MSCADSFAPDYATARARFVEAATAASGRLERLTHPEPGPDGDAVSCDVAWFGPPEAEAVLVTLSGTHGVEGFAGSGAQVDWLRRSGGAARLPPGVGVLMIHGVNPHGFAWERRVTHENVDLNRNWVDFDAPLPENPGYDRLAMVITPDVWTDFTRPDAEAAFKAYAAEHGQAALGVALSGGQYRHPDGVYFGGDGPTWSRRAQTAIFEHYLAHAVRIGLIDVHTGLGPRGIGEQIVTAPRTTDAFRRARAWYGAALTSTLDGSSASSPLVGDGLSAAPDLLRHAEVTAMALEFGTLPGEQVIWSLIADNWLHARGDPQGPLALAVKRDIRAAFYVESDDWKGMVVAQFELACRQALRGLASRRGQS